MRRLILFRTSTLFGPLAESRGELVVAAKPQSQTSLPQSAALVSLAIEQPVQFDAQSLGLPANNALLDEASMLALWRSFLPTVPTPPDRPFSFPLH